MGLVSPVWVKRRHSAAFGVFPLYPRKQTSTVYSQYQSSRVFTRIAFGMMAKIGSSSS